MLTFYACDAKQFHLVLKFTDAFFDELFSVAETGFRLQILLIPCVELGLCQHLLADDESSQTFNRKVLAGFIHGGSLTRSDF